MDLWNYGLWMPLFSSTLYKSIESLSVKHPGSLRSLCMHCNWDMRGIEKKFAIVFLYFFRRENGIVNDTMVTFMEWNGIPPGCHGNLQKQTPVN